MILRLLGKASLPFSFSLSLSFHHWDLKENSNTKNVKRYWSSELERLREITERREIKKAILYNYV